MQGGVERTPLAVCGCARSGAERTRRRPPRRVGSDALKGRSACGGHVSCAARAADAQRTSTGHGEAWCAAVSLLTPPHDAPWPRGGALARKHGAGREGADGSGHRSHSADPSAMPPPLQRRTAAAYCSGYRFIPQWRVTRRARGGACCSVALGTTWSARARSPEAVSYFIAHCTVIRHLTRIRTHSEDGSSMFTRTSIVMRLEYERQCV